MCHGGARAAPEVVFGLLSPTWRLDPRAVAALAPVWQAVRAMRAGRLPLESWLTVAGARAAGGGRAVGPVAAALATMKMLGFGEDITCWRAAGSHWRPAERHQQETLRLLLDAWHRSQWALLARRRPALFGHLAAGADHWASRRLLAAKPGPAETARSLPASATAGGPGRGGGSLAHAHVPPHGSRDGGGTAALPAPAPVQTSMGAPGAPVPLAVGAAGGSCSGRRRTAPLVGATGPLAPDAAGALRTVMAGGVITESVASHWSGRPRLCPHCGREDEDLEHRLWRCPRWDRQRSAATAGLVSPQALRRRISDGVASTGILAAPRHLVALAGAASTAGPELPREAEWRPLLPRRTVWSDGACLHPTDPLLARAGWGLSFGPAGGAVGATGASLAAAGASGPVDGDQTAQRAEVTAAVAAVHALAESVDLVSDSTFVVDGCAALAAGGDSISWAHADLWARLAPHARSGRLVARWTPAHKTAEEYRQAGREERDRLGNEAADIAAGMAAAARVPAPAVVAERMRELRLLGLAQRVMAAAQLAAVSANHAAQPGAQPRVRRRWAAVQRGTRERPASAPPAAEGANGGRRGRRQQAGVQAAPPRVHLQPPAAAVLRWTPHVAARGPGFVACLRCGRAAETQPRLGAIACPGWAAALPPRVSALLLLGGELEPAARPPGGLVGAAGGYHETLVARLAERFGAPD